MAHAFTQVVATGIATKSFFATARSSTHVKASSSSSSSSPSSLDLKSNATQWDSAQPSAAAAASPLPRRILNWGMVGVTLGWNMVVENRATAAARRPPPPPTQAEPNKKDPNVSGVLAKVLASKKRKEDMKLAVTKLREKGKPIE
ncbi:hypothetical protein Dimus_023888 [Dionaea muscipula]